MQASSQLLSCTAIRDSLIEGPLARQHSASRLPGSWQTKSRSAAGWPWPPSLALFRTLVYPLANVSRTVGESVIPSVSPPAKKSAASPSASTRSRRLRVSLVAEDSRSKSRRNSTISSASIRPLNLKTILPFEALWILSIVAILRIHPATSNPEPEFYADEMSVARASLLKRLAVREVFGVEGGSHMPRNLPVAADLAIRS